MADNTDEGGRVVANFSTETRRKALQRMADEELDVLVIGGGITGSGIALDAASRGFTVAVVERDDFAAGASGRSSRMVHGGLRYLEQREVRLVRESLQERSRLMRLAPHLVRPIPMYAPIATASERRRWRTALTAYDALAVGSTIRRHYTRSVSTVARAIPGLGNPTPALVYHECATDDARLTLEVARAALAAGALVANHADVQALRGAGRVRGAIVVDRQTGEQLEVAARVTVNAGGVWAAHVQGLATATPVELRPSKGVHLVFRPGAVTTRVGVVIPSGAGDGRHLFVLPWGDRSFAGTTDTPYQGTFDDLRVTAADRAYVLAAVAQFFPTVQESDVLAAWAGLRPLIDDGPRRRDGATVDLSRRHALFESPPGLLTVTGGKLTTYRATAEQTVDRLAALLGRGGRCRTGRIVLGLHGSLRVAMELAAAEAGRLGLPRTTADRLVLRYGDGWADALRLIRDDPGLGDLVRPDAPVLRVELQLARTHEMALSEADVMVRRTRLTSYGPSPGVASNLDGD